MSRPLVSSDTNPFIPHLTLTTDLNSSSDLNPNQSLIKDQKNDQANVSNSSTNFSKSASTNTPSTSSTSTNSTSISSNHTEASPPGSAEKGSKKTKIPASPRTPPKLTSLSPKSSSFRLPAQPIPRSPRAIKESKELSPRDKKSSDYSKYISDSSQSTKQVISTTHFANSSSETLSASHPEIVVSPIRLVSRVVKKEIPTQLLENLGNEYAHHTLINLMIDDICAGSLSLDNRHAIGRGDSAFYIEKLPSVLQAYIKDQNQKTISCSQLLINIFSSAFHANEGWSVAKILYANLMFQEKNKIQIPIGENIHLVEDAERKKLKNFAEVIAKTIFGKPASIKNSPLPKILIDDLVYADQYFHEKLLNHKSTKNWSIEQMRDARYSLLKLLSVTRLLMPMFTRLAGKQPSQQEIWCLGLILQNLLGSAFELAKEILPISFSSSNLDLQKRVQEKEKNERIQSRTKTFKTKQPSRHVRSRSADTTPIDLKLLLSPQEARKKRAIEKTSKAIASFVLDDDAFDNVLKEGRRALEEGDQIRKAQQDLKEFNLDDIKQIEQMLADRDEQELINLIPDGDFIPERAQPLPESTADLAPQIYSEANPSSDAVGLSATAEVTEKISSTEQAQTTETTDI